MIQEIKKIAWVVFISVFLARVALLVILVKVILDKAFLLIVTVRAGIMI
jgi:hypothetical protein